MTGKRSGPDVHRKGAGRRGIFRKKFPPPYSKGGGGEAPPFWAGRGPEIDLGTAHSETWGKVSRQVGFTGNGAKKFAWGGSKKVIRG